MMTARCYRPLVLGTLLPLLTLAQPQRPQRGAAQRLAQFRWEELAPRPLTDADPPRRSRQIPAPLATKDRWELYELHAISPAMERLLAPPARVPAPRQNAPATPRLLTGFPGARDDVTAIPPDTTGAVGPSHVMTTLNNNFQVQLRDGAVVRLVTAEQFFERLGPFSGGVFDPRVVYDPVSSRWLAVSLADARLASSAILLAVSDTSDPGATWTQARIEADAASGLWFDYPNLALVGDRVFLSVNLFRQSSFQRSEIFLFTVGDLLGSRFVFRRFQDSRGTPVAPASATALPRIPVITQSGNVSGQAVLRVREITGPAGAELYDDAVRVIPVGEPYTFAPLEADFAPQLGSTARISTNDARMQNCVASEFSFYCAHHIFVPVGNPQRVAVQYYEVALSDYALRQRGRVEDPNNVVQYAFPSLAVNRLNDVLIGYSRFAPDQYAAAAYSLRLAVDPPGQLQPDALLKRGEAPYRRGTNENRWGDYSATVVDPVDGVSFWTIQTYAASTSTGGGNRWGTWWGRIEPRAAPCAFSVSPSAIAVGPGATTISATVTTAPGCRWMAAADAGWINLTSGSNGEGSGNVVATVAVNPSFGPRGATLTVAGQTVTLQQAGNPSPPATQLSVTSLTVPAAAVVGERFNLSAAVRNVSSVASGAFRLGFFLGRSSMVSTNDIRLGGCTFVDGLDPDASTTCGGALASLPSLNPGVYFIAAIADDRRETSMTDRSLAVRVANPTEFAPSPLAPAFSAASIAHGATAAGGPISPGQVIVIYGNRMASETLRQLRLDSNGRVATELDTTQVTFDGIPAPLLYTSSGQLSCVVPFEIAPGLARVQIEYRTRRSAEVMVPVTALAPGFFTLDFSGRGAGAFVNSADGTVITPTNPARRGEVVLLYATGGGPYRTPLPDGALVTGPTPLAQPVEVTIGGLRATVLYAGGASGLVAGLLQINVLIPGGVTPGEAVPVTLRVGGVAAPGGVTLAVR